MLLALVDDLVEPEEQVTATEKIGDEKDSSGCFEDQMASEQERRRWNIAEHIDLAKQRITV